MLRSAGKQLHDTVHKCGHECGVSYVSGMTRPGKRSTAKSGIESRSAALKVDVWPQANEAVYKHVLCLGYEYVLYCDNEEEMLAWFIYSFRVSLSGGRRPPDPTSLFVTVFVILVA